MKNKDIKTQLLLGVALFLTIMYLMNNFFPPQVQKPQGTAQQNPGAQAITPASPLSATTTQLTGEVVKAAENDSKATPINDITVVTKEFTAKFSTLGAGMESYALNNYYNLPPEKKDRIPLPLAGVIQDKNLSLSMGILRIGANIYKLNQRDWKVVLTPADVKIADVPSKGSKLIFQTMAGDIRLSRIYDFASKDSKDKFGFDHYLVIENTSTNTLVADYTISGPAGIIPDDTDQRFGILNGVSGYLDSGNSIVKDETPLSKLNSESSFAHSDARTAWMGIYNRFFSSILMSNQPNVNLTVNYNLLNPTQGFYNNYPPQAKEWLETTFKAHTANATVWLTTNIFEIGAGKSIEHSYRYYGGPMEDRIASSFSEQLDTLVSYSWSWLGSISDLLIIIMEKIVGVVGNYGIAIILLTIFVKLCLLPLTRKSMRSQHKMQQVQPLIKAAKEKYKNDQKKQQAETMRIFKENGVSPVGGCLPMLIQLPIFFALYGAFSRSFLIRQQDFIPGWINDLSQPDHLFKLPFTVPIVDWNYFNLLPVIYLLMQLLHMHMMPKSADPTAQQQQKMMKYMPIIFVFIFYSMPSGLVLYFVTQSFLTVVEHWFIKRSTDHELVAGTAPATNKEGKEIVAAGTGIKGHISHKNKKKSKK